VLADAGLVSAEKRGRHRVYRLDPHGMGNLRAEMARFWTRELDLLLEDATAIAAHRDAGEEGTFRAG
jgi:DNA-binding transcriptional ArsR family regulator